jgi:hypothetical protein
MPMSLRQIHSHIILPNLLDAAVGDSEGRSLGVCKNFSLEVKCLFCRGFCEKRVQEEVFLWSICGGTLVDGGLLTASFLVGENATRVRDLFLSSSRFGKW